MLSNLFDSRFIAQDKNVSFLAYLRSLRHDPAKMLRVFAVIIFPGLALGWWGYSLAMSVSALAPLRSATAPSDEIIIPDSRTTPAVSTLPSMESADAADNASSATSSSKINVSIDGNTAESSTVEVNGQSVPVPADGSSHQVIQNDNGKTTIDINVDADTSGTSKSRSSTSVNLRSSSRTDLNTESEETR